MKVVILAGGLGTRLSEETVVKPKPMVEIGGRPILWHIMKLYASYGMKDFAIALGYKGGMIKDYFLDYYRQSNDVTVDLVSGDVETYEREAVDWRVSLVDTGSDTQTGGRIRRMRPHLGGGTFMATYGDGVGDINVSKLLAFHRAHGRLATITAVRPPSRFGEIEFEGDAVCSFNEKPQAASGWINGGFFVLEPEVIDYIEGDTMPFERAPLESLASEGQLMAYRHDGFWQPMDTLREKQLLEQLWEGGNAPWKVWNDEQVPILAR
jgi:glucose-1-phosphate cytidylyltransferase